MPPPAQGIVGAERMPLRLSAVLLKWRRRQRPSVQSAACTGRPAPPLRLPPCLPPLATAPLFRPPGRRWRLRTKNPPTFCCRTSAAASWARAKVTAFPSAGPLGPLGREWPRGPRSVASSPASARGRCVGAAGGSLGRLRKLCVVQPRRWLRSRWRGGRKGEVRPFICSSSCSLCESCPRFVAFSW